MFGYNPQVQDRSGEILANYQMQGNQLQQQGTQALANGMTATGDHIASALDQMAQINRLHQQAMGTAGAAHSLKLIDSDQLAQFNQMAPAAQIGFAQNIAPLIQAKGMAAYHSGLLDMKQQALDTKGPGSGTITNLY